MEGSIENQQKFDFFSYDDTPKSYISSQDAHTVRVKYLNLSFPKVDPAQEKEPNVTTLLLNMISHICQVVNSSGRN